MKEGLKRAYPGKVDRLEVGQRVGLQGQIEILSIDPPPQVKYCKIKCHQCAKDPALFGDAIYTVGYLSTRYGSTPCGCSPSTKWTQAQDSLRITRLLENSDLSFEGYDGVYIGSMSKVLLKCKIDGNVMSKRRSTISDISLPVCPVCEENTHVHIRREQKLLGSGHFLRGTVFTPIGDPSLQMYKYTCPNCSTDEYTTAGVCGGEFVSNYGCLMTGRKPCRCSTSYRWTSDQRAKQLTDILAEDISNKSTFLGWQESYCNATTSVGLFECSEHGVWEGLSGQVVAGKRCTVCSTVHKSEAGFVYVLYAESNTSSFTGYGITSVPDRRFYTHKANLKKAGFSIAESELFEFDKGKHRSVEVALKREYPRYPQDIEGFKLEATLPTMYEDVVAFVRRKCELKVQIPL